jgi:hypothetical protein
VCIKPSGGLEWRCQGGGKVLTAEAQGSLDGVRLERHALNYQQGGEGRGGVGLALECPA